MGLFTCKAKLESGGGEKGSFLREDRNVPKADMFVRFNLPRRLGKCIASHYLRRKGDNKA